MSWMSDQWGINGCLTWRKNSRKETCPHILWMLLVQLHFHCFSWADKCYLFEKGYFLVRNSYPFGIGNWWEKCTITIIDNGTESVYYYFIQCIITILLSSCCIIDLSQPLSLALSSLILSWISTSASLVLILCVTRLLGTAWQNYILNRQ